MMTEEEKMREAFLGGCRTAFQKYIVEAPNKKGTYEDWWEDWKKEWDETRKTIQGDIMINKRTKEETVVVGFYGNSPILREDKPK